MNGWNIAYLVLIVLGVGIALAKDGQPKEGNHSFWATVLSSLLSILILYKGGFFG